MEKVIKDQGLEDVNGFLYTIISRISEIVKANRLVLTNELLDGQVESFKELIDSIDISIIDLLSEEIEIEELEITIRNLIEQTFAKFQANTEQSETLSTIVTLRGQKLKPIIQSNEFKYLKQSGATLRTYLDLVDQLQLENPIWQEVTDSLQSNWLDFIFDEIISTQPTYITRVSKFNSDNGTGLDMADIRKIMILWMNGSWFNTLSLELNLDIDICLRIINSLISFNTQNLAASIVRNAELRLADNKITISPIALNFPQYLLYGFKSEIQLKLIEIGFNDRISILTLGSILDGSNIRFNSLNELKVYLRQNEDQLLEGLSLLIPEISLDKSREAFSFLKINNIT